MKMKLCTGLFAHSMNKLKTVKTTAEFIHKLCITCGYVEKLPRSRMPVIFYSNSLLQTKRWAHDDNRKELLQPLTRDGDVNEEFTQAYGYNPFDDRTKDQTPRVQGGNAIA